MTFYTEMAEVAGDLLDEFGITITLTRVTGATPKLVSTGTAVAGTSTTYSPKGVVKNYPSNLIDGTLIRQGDKMVILDNTIEPEMADELTFHGSTWNIVSITNYKPADTAICYSVQVRK